MRSRSFWFVMVLAMLFAGHFAFADEIVSISATVPGVVPGGPDTGGGGGGGGFVADTAITFSGRAYPLSKVTILRDGNVALTTVSGPDAIFTASLHGLSQGNYNFSVYSEDQNGLHSTPFSFPLFLTEGATTTVSGIYISPTIDVDKTVVKQGDNISIFGISSPLSTITISVHSPVEHFVETKSDVDGVYLYTYDTSDLELGSHAAKSKSKIENTASEFGAIATFAVGNETKIKDSKCGKKGDLNNNCKVNIVDFSIMAYWYKRPDVPTSVDLNGDGVITIVDFSILAYNWTG